MPSVFESISVSLMAGCACGLEWCVGLGGCRQVVLCALTRNPSQTSAANVALLL